MTPLMEKNARLFGLNDMKVDPRIPAEDDTYIIPAVDSLLQVCENPVGLCSAEGVTPPTRIHVLSFGGAQRLGWVTPDGVFVYTGAPSVTALLAWAAVTDLGRDRVFTPHLRSELAGAAYAIEDLFRRAAQVGSCERPREVFDVMTMLVEQLYEKDKCSRFEDGYTSLLEPIWDVGVEKYWPKEKQKKVKEFF